jgi:hypothetical protein
VLARVAPAARPFRAPDGRFYASVPVDGHLECHELESAGFRRWLTRVNFGARRGVPSAAALASTRSALAAHAELTDAVETVFVRIARSEARTSYFLDLGDRSRRAIEIRPDGWCIIDRPAVHFRRSAGQLALPTPARDGSIDLLRKYVNLDERDFPLLVGWLTLALRPVGPYPIAVVTGEQGSAVPSDPSYSTASTTLCAGAIWLTAPSSSICRQSLVCAGAANRIFGLTLRAITRIC